jgi:predicted dehydrogenase
MKTVTVGIIGAGFASKFHCRSFSRVAGIDVRLKSVADVDAGKASALAGEFGLEECHGDYRVLLDDPEIDVIDICTPPFLPRGPPES